MDSSPPPKRPQTPNGSVYERQPPPTPPAGKKKHSKRTTAGFENPSWKSKAMMPLVEAASIDAVPAKAKTVKSKAAFLAKSERRFRAVKPDGTPDGIVQGKKNLILGHRGSASNNWNKGRHRQSRKDNLKYNADPTHYQGLERAKASAASGSTEPRYGDPGPHHGSHRSHFEPSHPGYDPRSPFPQYTLLRPPNSSAPVAGTTPVPWSYSQTDPTTGAVSYRDEAIAVPIAPPVTMPAPLIPPPPMPPPVTTTGTPALAPPIAPPLVPAPLTMALPPLPPPAPIGPPMPMSLPMSLAMPPPRGGTAVPLGPRTTPAPMTGISFPATFPTMPTAPAPAAPLPAATLAPPATSRKRKRGAGEIHTPPPQPSVKTSKRNALHTSPHTSS